MKLIKNVSLCMKNDLRSMLQTSSPVPLKEDKKSHREKESFFVVVVVENSYDMKKRVSE
jgi:hypothetical protein